MGCLEFIWKPSLRVNLIKAQVDDVIPQYMSIYPLHCHVYFPYLNLQLFCAVFDELGHLQGTLLYGRTQLSLLVRDEKEGVVLVFEDAVWGHLIQRG